VISENDLKAMWDRHVCETQPQAGVRDWFKRSPWLSEKLAAAKYALLKKHLRPYPRDASRVITASRLTRPDLTALLQTQEACAIHIPRFCSPEVAMRMSRLAALEHTQWMLAGNIATDMFYAAGSLPREVAKRRWPEFRRYFTERESFLARQRSMAEDSWPVDVLSQELAALWPSGATLAQWQGHPVRPAIMRVMKDRTHGAPAPAHGLGFIHTDGSLVNPPLEGLFSANIYYQLPERGGRLFVWGVNLTEVRGLRDALRVEALMSLDGRLFDARWQTRFRELLPEPYVIEPKAGDLVLIHTGRPHSVEPVHQGTRVTNQLFIQAQGSRALQLLS
jgi:hypothetical protein